MSAARISFLLLVASILFSMGGCDGAADTTVKKSTPVVRAGPEAELSDPRLEKAVSLVVSGEYAAARVILERLLDDHPGAPRATFYLALTYHKEHLYDVALRHYERLFESGRPFENDHRARYFHGWCLYNLGRPEQARRAFEESLAAAPDTGDAHFGLGLALTDEGRLAEAAASFRRAIALAAGKGALEAKSRTRLADVLAQDGRLDEARRELERATELRPERYNAHYKLYRVLLELGRADEAAAARRRFDEWRARVPGVSAE